MKNSLRIHKWTHNEFNIFILGVLTHPPFHLCDLVMRFQKSGICGRNILVAHGHIPHHETPSFDPPSLPFRGSIPYLSHLDT